MIVSPREFKVAVRTFYNLSLCLHPCFVPILYNTIIASIVAYYFSQVCGKSLMGTYIYINYDNNYYCIIVF